MYQRSSPATVIGLTLIAGFIAGLLIACFHFFATELTMQQAINLETAHKVAIGQLEPEVFTRPEQRAGLLLGYIMYGVGWGALFGIICWFAFGQARLSEPGKLSWKWFFALLFVCYWTFCLFPQLKYPANPPGVGDGTTITIRQTLYLEGIFLSILGTVLALLLYRFLARLEEQGTISRILRLSIVILAYVLYTSILWFTLPPYPITVPISMDIVLRFRWLSAIGVALFWYLLGMIFSVLWQHRWRRLAKLENRQQRQRSRPLLVE